jgi:poly(3-hydroxybutyrate) depolymerase
LPAWFAAFNRALLFGGLAAVAGYRPLGAKPRSRAAVQSAARSAAADPADIPDDDLFLVPHRAQAQAGATERQGDDVVSDLQAEVGRMGADIVQALT